VGPGNVTLINPRRFYPHNTYLDVAAELGFPGLLAFLGIAGLSLRDAFRAHARAQRDQKVIALGVESALVATAVFWLFFSMFPHKVPWFLMAIASASARAGPASAGMAHQRGCRARTSISSKRNPVRGCLPSCRPE
jgi:O-antigen ligase